MLSKNHKDWSVYLVWRTNSNANELLKVNKNISFGVVNPSYIYTRSSICTRFTTSLQLFKMDQLSTFIGYTLRVHRNY